MAQRKRWTVCQVSGVISKILIKKFRFSKIDGSQDDGFCFSTDGKYLYNIERHVSSCTTALSVYETSRFERVQQLFLNDTFELTCIECDVAKNQIFVSGFTRDENRIASEYFVAILQNDRLHSITSISQKDHGFINGFKDLEIMGFTDKAKKWSYFQYTDKSKLIGIESQKILLSDYVE